MGTPQQSEALYTEGAGRVLGNLANARAVLGDTQCAIAHYEKSLDIAKQVANETLEASACLNLALLLVQEKQPHAARAYAETATRLFRAIGYAEYVERAEQVLRKLGGPSR